MISSLRSAMRPMGVVMTFLMILTQTACAPLQTHSAGVPDPPQDGGQAPDDGVSDLPDMGTAFTVAIVVIGAVVIYKMLTRDREEAEDRSESELLIAPAACSFVASADRGIPYRPGSKVQCGGNRAP